MRATQAPVRKDTRCARTRTCVRGVPAARLTSPRPAGCGARWRCARRGRARRRRAPCSCRARLTPGSRRPRGRQAGAAWSRNSRSGRGRRSCPRPASVCVDEGGWGCAAGRGVGVKRAARALQAAPAMCAWQRCVHAAVAGCAASCRHRAPPTGRQAGQAWQAGRARRAFTSKRALNTGGVL